MRRENGGRADRDDQTVKFCPQCGATLIAGARFCVECGDNLANYTHNRPSAPAGAPDAPGLSRAVPTAPRTVPAGPTAESGVAATTLDAEPADNNSIFPFAAIFVGILAVGTVVAILIMRQLPARNRLLASAPPPPAASAGPSAAGQQFPPGHPTVQLPKEALDFIAKLQKKADANPKDLAVWNQLGDVLLRAAAFDPSYYPRAAEAYAHVLKADPENLDALRGAGNIDFDQRKFDEAIAAYEHYLSHKPDDPDVRTDLGTMYLSTGNADQAVIQYRKVLAQHPQFFEAYFNMGVAYGQMNRMADAKSTFEAALKIAPDQQARDRVNQMIASLNGAGAGGGESGGATAAAAGGASGSGQPTVATGTPATFQGAMEQMLRNLPIAGPKVQTVQWSSPTDARVLMDNFPMDQMPPFAAQKFLSDLKAGIDQVKSSHQISTPVEVNICDAASGRVMQSVTE